jgi:hypothetical protein
MPKKLFAITNIKGTESDGGMFFAAGDEVDHTAFSKDQLKELLDAGAVEIRDNEDEPATPVPADEDLQPADEETKEE